MTCSTNDKMMPCSEEQIPIISFKYFQHADQLTGCKNLAEDPEGQKLAQQVDKALSEHGLFFAIDHGIDEDLCSKVLQDFKEFFQQPLEKKRIYELSRKNEQRGYMPLYCMSGNAYMGRNDHIVNDAIERFLFGDPDPLYKSYQHDPSSYVESWAPNVYANCFRHSVTSYYKDMKQFCNNTLKVMSIAIGQQENYLESLSNRVSHPLKMNYYPAVEKTHENQNRLSPHVDVNPMAIILQDEVKDALKVQKVNGRWVYANPPVKHALLIMLGRCMEILTNRHWPAVQHVVPFPDDNNGKSISRLSVPFLVHFNDDTVLESVPKYADSAILDKKEDSTNFWQLQQKVQKRMLSHLMQQRR